MPEDITTIEQQQADDRASEESGRVQVNPSIPVWAKRVAEAQARVNGSKYTDVLREWIVAQARAVHPSAVPAVSLNGQG